MRHVKSNATGTSGERLPTRVIRDPRMGPVQGESVTDVNESVTGQLASSVIYGAGTRWDDSKYEMVTVTLGCGHQFIYDYIPSPPPDPFERYICWMCNAP